MKYESPQTRRLRNDLAAMEQLAEESSVMTFQASGRPATRYKIWFQGRSLTRERGKVCYRDRHEIDIRLGASYPRTMPELRWSSPVYHPNISEIGLVCLGGYGTHWVPSLHLDELCEMLWDMCRYHNYDVRSPYNRDAALWVANQTSFTFPTDPRPLRDKRVAQGRIEPIGIVRSATSKGVEGNGDDGKEEERAESIEARLAGGEAVILLDEAAETSKDEPESGPDEVIFID